MSTFTLYPSAYLSGMDATFYGETPYTTTPETIRQYLADADDATFAERSSPPGYIVTQQVTFELPNPTIPADEFIARVEGFVRWSQGGSGVFVGAAPYLGATPPASIPYVTTDGRVTPTTSTPFVQNVAWNAVDANNCNLLWLEGSQEDLAWVRTHQIGARLKTIKHSTCTVVDKTTLIDATPVISVPVTSTLDWESAEPVNSALRKVDVEMRIELGGTVPESGTLIGTATDTFQLASSGTTTRYLTATDPIPNGTYKVYARATRNRATGAALDDQVGPWSAGATLIVNVPLPTTPTVFVIEEEFGDSVTVSATPIATASYTDPTVDVERSDDDRVTWTRVRSGSGVVGAFGQPVDVTDVECARAGDVLTNLATNPSFESSAGTVTVRTNLVTNPSAELNISGWTGNFATLDRSTAHAHSGTASFSITAATATNCSLSLSGANRLTVLPGSSYHLSAYARSGTTPRTLRIDYAWEMEDGTRVGSYSTAASTTSSTTSWTRLATSAPLVCPVGATRLLVVLVALAPVAGEVHYWDSVLIESSPALGDYFDGSTPPAGDFIYGWTGTPHESASVQNAVGVARQWPASGTTDGVLGGTRVYQSGDWAATGSKSMRITPVGTSFDTFASPGADSGALRLGMEPGKTYTALARIRLAGAQAGTLSSRARRIVVFTDPGELVVNSDASPNSAGEHLIRLTFTVPSDATGAWIRLYNGSSAGNGDVWWDDFMLIEGAYSGPYFDGTLAPAGYGYTGWAGDADASISYAAERTPPFYRARVSALYDGETINASAWSTPTPVGLTADGWNLKAVEVPGLAFIEVPVIGEIIQELDEDVGVFRPLDRRLPVVVAGELTGYDGSLEIRLTEQWQWETLKSLIEAQRVLLMQRPYGDQQYIRFVDKRSIGLWGTPTNPQRRVILKYVETGAP